jgi:predicted nucleic acid-binding protein
MRGLFVDTGIWVALLDAADPFHQKAKTLVEEHQGIPFFVTDLVMSESITLLGRQLGADRAAVFGMDLLRRQGRKGHSL